MTDKGYEIKSFASDPFAVKERTQHATDLAEDAFSQDLIQEAQQNFGIDLSRTNIPAINYLKVKKS